MHDDEPLYFKKKEVVTLRFTATLPFLYGMLLTCIVCHNVDDVIVILLSITLIQTIHNMI